MRKMLMFAVGATLAGWVVSTRRRAGEDTLFGGTVLVPPQPVDVPTPASEPECASALDLPENVVPMDAQRSTRRRRPKAAVGVPVTAQSSAEAKPRRVRAG